METSFGIIILVISVLAGALGNSTVISRNTQFDSTTASSVSIYGGTKASIDKHPYMVSIQVDQSKYCTGAIVSDSWVLTTADCAQENRKRMNVVMHRRFNKVRKVKNVTLHPAYPLGEYDYDFACVQIRGRFHFSKRVLPVRLPKQNPSAGSTMVVAGWSATAFKQLTTHNKKPADELVEGTMTWLSDAACNSTLIQMGTTWTDRKACVFHRNKTTLCTGAWGAPVVKNGVLYGQFVGAEANGFCTSKASPLIFSDISSVSDWVHSVTGAMVDQSLV